MAVAISHQRRTGRGNGVGIALYAVTLVAELPSYLARAFLSIIPLLILGKVIGLPSSWPNALAVLLGVFPLAWSLIGAIWPASSGWWWKNRTGGRDPSQRERQAVADAFAPLAAHHPGLGMPAHWFVLDTGEIDAGVLGRSLMLSRGLIDSDSLGCVLAHELGHYHSTDGHLTAAINRLVPWPDPLGGTQRTRSGLIFWIFRGAFWVAGGGAGLFFLQPFWGSYWRQREYLADAYAAQLGVGEQLAHALETEILVYDRPVPFLWMSKHSHPPTELRVDRLRAITAGPST